MLTRSSNYTVTQPDRKKLENYTHRGVIVTHVIPDSVLGREGLKPDDLIYQINHRKIHSLEDYSDFLRDMLPRGRTIPMRYHIERRIGQNSWYRFIDFNRHFKMKETVPVTNTQKFTTRPRFRFKYTKSICCRH